MTWEQSSPFAAVSSLLGGFVDERDKQREAARQAELDKHTAADTAASIAYKEAQTKELADKSALAGGVSAYRKGLKVPENFGKLPAKDKASWLVQQSILAQQAGDTDMASILKDEAANVALSDEREALAGFTSGAKTDESKARTKLYGSARDLNAARSDYIRGWRIREQNKVAALARAATDRERAEAGRASRLAQSLAGRFQIAGMSQGGANERAAAAIDARETMGIMAQEFALEGRSATEAARLAQDQYQAQLKQWGTENLLGQATAAAAGQSFTPSAVPDFQPTINVNAGTQGGGTPQVILMPITLPDGRQVNMPHVFMAPPNPHRDNKAKKKPPNTTKTPPRPATLPSPTAQGPLQSLLQSLGGGAKSVWDALNSSDLEKDLRPGSM
jgi:hypothetical protein